MTGRRGKTAAWPIRASRAAWSFVDPPLKAGRVPYARSVVLMLLIATLTFFGYTAINKGMRLPFSAQPYLVDVVLPDAAGLDPAKGPAAAVAGVSVGKVVEVTPSRGQARVTLRLPAKLRGKIFADATAFLRPSTIIQTLMVDVTPGSPTAGPLRGAIRAERTGAFVAVDKLTGMLDVDTQAQAQLLISEATRALRGREPQLRRILAQVGDLSGGAATVARALDDRRRLLTRLMAQLGALSTTVGERGRELGDAVRLASRTLHVTGARGRDVQAAMRQLGPTLDEAERALVAGGALGDALAPALDRLTPVTGRLAPLASALHRATPPLDRLLGSAQRLVAVGARPARQLSRGLQGLDGRLRRESLPALRELLSVSGALVDSRDGLLNIANGVSGAVSTNRAGGPAVLGTVVGLEMGGPGEFGLAPGANRRRSDGTTTLAHMLAKALDLTCRRTNPLACWLRFTLPGLRDLPVLAPRPRQGAQ